MDESIEISSKVDAAVWAEFRELSEESDQSLSRLLTEAILDYVRRRRSRFEVPGHREDSIADNRELGRRLTD